MKFVIIMEDEEFVDDTSVEDEYQITYLDSLPKHLRKLAGRHHQDQFDAVPSYLQRKEKGKAFEQ